MKTQTQIMFNQFFNGTNEMNHFDGSDVVAELDEVRLTGQLKSIFTLMKDGKFRTLAEIEGSTGIGQASASAQLRNLRKERFGNFTVNKRRKGDPGDGLFEYQLTA